MLGKKILFYTDCFIFGGCERHIFEIISSSLFCSQFKYLLIYRSSNKYKEGMNQFFPALSHGNIRAMRLWDINTWNIYFEESITNIRLLKIIKKLDSLLFFLLTPFIFIYDFIILYFFFLREKADIIHINNGGYPGALGCRVAIIAARCSGKKRILLNVNNMPSKNNNIFDRFIDFFIKRSVSKVVTASKASSSALSVNRGFHKEKIINIHYGIRDNALSQSQTRYQGPIDKNTYCISMSARFEERKGHKYVLLALKKLISEHPEYKNIKLLLMGEGPLLSEIKNFVFNENLKQNTSFLGYIDNPIDYIASSLFLLNPSLGYEDLPYSVLEAMSVGIPVIGTNVAGIPEEIEDGITGIIVPPKDIEALSQAMYILLSDHKKRISMGKASKKRFFEQFSVERMVQDYISLYNRL